MTSYNPNDYSGRGKTEQGLTEQQVRNIVQEEMMKNYKSGSPDIPPHTHDGVNNLGIKESDIIPTVKATGTITMATANHVYTLKVVAIPKAVLFYGTAVNNNGSSPTIKAIVNGNAQLTQGSIFVGVDTSTVTAGPLQNIIQCSDSILIDTSALNKTAVRASEKHIVFVQDTTNVQLAVATVVDYSKSEIKILVEKLATGWQIIGSFLVI